MKQVRGVSYSKNDASLTYKEGFVPVLRAGNIQNSRIIHYDFVYIPKEGVKNVQLLKKGDILIAASSGSISIVGKAAMILQDMNAGFGAFCKVLRPNKEIVNEDYFKFYFETPHYKNTISQLAEGANINNLKTEHFDNLELYLPPLPQQQKIAKILDAADSLRQNDKSLIAKYDELTQALFLDMFGDIGRNIFKFPIVKLDEVCSKITDGEHGTVERLDSGKLYLMARNIRDNYIDFSDVSFISEEDHKKIFKRCNAEKGDLLLVCVGATIGRACITPDVEQFSLARSVALLKPNKKINSLYLYTAISSKYIQEVIKRSGNSSAQAGLYTGKIKEIQITLPPISLQNQFAERVTQIEEQKAIAQKSLEQSERLFNSLLQKAFKGEL